MTNMTQKCHFIGIGGIGMSGLARILLSKNFQVSGSDLSESYVTEGLVRAGAKVFFGHSSQHISPDMTVVYTSDIKLDNPEYQAALDLKCKMLHRSDLLLQLMHEYKTLAIAGTHGKTTTTALLATVLKGAGWDPAFAVGGMLPQLQANGGYGSGDYFVAEADESDGTFLKYQSWGAIVTNIDNDHMDYYKTDAALDAAFEEFLTKVSSEECLFWCGDDARLAKLKPRGIGYGFNKEAQLRISNFRQEGWRIIFDIDFNRRHFADIEVSLTGRHNALNAAAVFGLALALGVPEDSIRSSLKQFGGVMRRCEKKGDVHGVLVLDDYAHHPTEIMVTLKAIREAVRERRLIVVFQPHRYSRTQECLGSYGKIFDEADHLIVTDIYGAREAPIPGVTSDAIIQEIRERAIAPCRYVQRKGIVDALTDYLRPHDVVVTLGAGDITKLGVELLNHIKIYPPRKWKVGVVCGGRSAEHDISLLSAQFVLKSIRREYYDVSLFGVSKRGKWLSGPSVIEELSQGMSVNEYSEPLISASILEELSNCDLLFPMMHGPFGEDGTIQGFFDMLSKPYVGCNHCSSAICMDKAITKKLMLLNGVATVPFIDFSEGDWKSHAESLLRQINSQLSYPLFVKPVHLGSTIGVVKVEQEEDLIPAIESAFRKDNHILVEKGLKIREIEFAVLGNRWVTVFPPGEVVTGGKVHDYDSKYSPNGALSIPKIELPKEKLEEGLFLAETAYKAAGCSGLARIDFFMDDQGKFWLNEINPMPGCTPMSLFPMMCAANNLYGPDLMDRLVILALERASHRFKDL